MMFMNVYVEQFAQEVMDPPHRPTRKAFRKLITIWDRLDKIKRSSVQDFPSNRFLAIIIQDTIEARKKIENYLWYLSVRLFPLALHSDNLDLTQKQQLRTTMIKLIRLSPSAKLEMLFLAALEKKSLKIFWTR